MRRATLALACFVALVLVMVAPAAAQDPGPVADAMATLAAATARAEQIRASQRATQAALSVRATQSALDELQRQRAATATAQAQSLAATQSAIDDLNRQRAMTATAQAANMAATVTTQAVMIAAQQTRTAQEAADAARLSDTYATRQERFTFGLLLVEIFFVCGAAFVLWHGVKTLVAWAKRMRPQAERPLSRMIDQAGNAGSTVIDAQPAGPRMPETMTVVDDPGMVEAINRWAEKFDAERGLNYGN